MFALDLAWDRPAKLPNETTEHVLRVRITPQQNTTAGLPLSLAIALDTSGSMNGEKLRAAKEALHLLVSLLRSGDRLSLCSFNSQVTPILDNTSGHEPGVRQAIDQLQANGTTRTDLALEWLGRVLPAADGIARVAILITDGKPTNPKGVALDDVAPLLDQSAGLATRQITLCAVGLGNAADFNTSFLTNLSDRGKGTFLYADTPASLEPQLRERLQTVQAIASEGANLNLRYLMDGLESTGVCRYRPEFAPLEETEGATVALGALSAHLTTDILIGLTVPALRQSLNQNSRSQSHSVISVDLQATGMPSPVTATVSLLYTHNYREATQYDSEVDTDRLGWEINLYQDEVQRLGTSDPNRTGELLMNMQVNALKSGRINVAQRAEDQLKDLKQTGNLNPHKTAEMTRDFRNTQGGLA